MIHTIIFDIGNVLAKFAWEEYLIERGYPNEIITRVGNATVNSALWKELDRSVELSCELTEQFCSQDLGVRKEIEDFLEQSHLVVQEYDYSVELVQRLKKNGYKIYLLSNYGGRNFNYARDNFKFINYVDGGLISYETGFVKPEPEIFQAFIKKYCVNPEQAVFLDDTMKNLEVAKAFGFHTIHFTDLASAVDQLHRLEIRY